MRRKISIFGATGSIGLNTIDLIERRGGAETYEVIALTGANNIALLAENAKKLDAKFAVTALPELLPELEERLDGCKTKALAGSEALEEVAALPVDWTMSAIVGSAGLPITLNSAKHGGILALANKESLVCAGALLKQICAEHGTSLIPVDSEHSAIFQCLRGENEKQVERIILTASGGPFRNRSYAAMVNVTPQEAIAHPNWSMGERISVDSASMFNKALEMIEAKELFSIDENRVEVVIHPQSIIHSMVGFTDGALMAQLGPSDMRGPIGFALDWPERKALPIERLDFTTLSRLDFEAPDSLRFPALALARRVMQQGGLSGAVMNAAKEQALTAFLRHQIGFLEMAEIVEKVLDHHHLLTQNAAQEIEQIIEADILAREYADRLIIGR